MPQGRCVPLTSSNPRAFGHVSDVGTEWCCGRVNRSSDKGRESCAMQTGCVHVEGYKSTSLIRNCAPVRPFSRLMLRGLWWS